MTNTLPIQNADEILGNRLTTDMRNDIEVERVSRANDIRRICYALHDCGAEDVTRTRLYQLALRDILIEMGVPLRDPAVEAALRLMPATVAPLDDAVSDVLSLSPEA